MRRFRRLVSPDSSGRTTDRCAYPRVQKADPRNRRTRTVPSFSGLNFTGRDGSWRTSGAGEVGIVRGRQADRGGRKRTLSAGGRCVSSKWGAVIPLVAGQAPGRQLARFGRELVRHPSKLLEAARLRMKLRTTRYLSSCWVEAMNGNTATFWRRGRTWQEVCDYLAARFGFRPNVEGSGANSGKSVRSA
jgi:hypothetical protein